MFMFTRHAVERYLQFWEPDLPYVEARQKLAEASKSAVRAQHKTARGDTVWQLGSLGIEVVTKHEDGIDVVVTILPPPVLRGLTPEQAERVFERHGSTSDVLIEIAKRQYLATKDGKVQVEQGGLDGPGAKLEVEIETVADVPFVGLSFKPVDKDGDMCVGYVKRFNDRLALLKKVSLALDAERATLTSIMKTMRVTQGSEPAKEALRIALRYIRGQLGISVDADEAWAEIAATELGSYLLSSQFIEGVKK